MSEISTRLRRRRYLLLRVGDDPVLDLGRFFRGEIEVRDAPQCKLPCHGRGESLPVTTAELTLVMTVPADRWLTAAELQPLDREALRASPGLEFLQERLSQERRDKTRSH